MRQIYFLMFILSMLTQVQAASHDAGESGHMPGHVFVVSEWLPKENCEQELWTLAKTMMALTEQESGCVRAHATRQIAHPGAPGTTEFKIICLQEYIDLAAFETHCSSAYVTHFFKNYVENTETSIVQDWRCRLFSEDE